MATALWVRTIRRHRMDKQLVIPCDRIDPTDALVEACHQLDISVPLWLDKNSREWDEFAQTRFLPDAFMDSVDFDRLEIEFLPDDGVRRKINDPRNAF